MQHIAGVALAGNSVLDPPREYVLRFGYVAIKRRLAKRPNGNKQRRTQRK
jgi:hypothetical protein